MTYQIGDKVKVISGEHGCDSIVGRVGEVKAIVQIRDEVVLHVALDGWHDDGVFHLFDWQVEACETKGE